MCFGMPSFHETVAQLALHLHGVQLDARFGKDRLEPAVKLREHGVVFGVRPVGLVDYEEDVGAVAVGARLDVAAGEEACLSGAGRTPWRFEVPDLVGVDVEHQEREAGLALPRPPPVK